MLDKGKILQLRKPAPEIPTGRRVADRWTENLAKGGHAPVARTFLHNYSRLSPPLTHGEAMFVVHLLDFKWGKEAPFPGYRRLATYLGVTEKQARRLAKSLEDKGYLRREIRVDQTNRFHLEGLYVALEKLMADGNARK